MPRAILPIANGFYQSSSLPIASQECTNFYPNVVQAPALNQETLLGTPGLNLVGSTGDLETNRGGHEFEGIPYFVNGNVLYRVNETIVDSVPQYSIESLGAIEGSGFVSMADNGSQLCILVPGGKGYIFTTGPDTLTEITDVDFRASGDPQYVVELDRYFVFTTNQNKFIISALNDGLAYNALDFGSGEKVEGDLVSLLSFNGQLYLFGEYTTAVYQNRPSGADFPFLFSGLTLSKGLDSPFSVVQSSNSFMFIGGAANESPAIWAFSGNDVQKVSTTAIDSILRQEDVSSAVAWSYAESGAYFVGFTLQNTSLVRDTVTGLWHERKSTFFDAREVSQTVRYRANSFVQAYGRIFCGDFLNGNIGILSVDTYTEYDNVIKRVVATQPFQNNMESFTVPYIELTTESGVGDDSVIDPKVGMAISRDGKSFSPERLRSLGKTGETSKRAIWYRNGRMPRFCVIRFTMSDAVKPVIIQLTADIAK